MSLGGAALLIAAAHKGPPRSKPFRELLVLHRQPEQLNADVFHRLGFAHPAEFFGFAFVMRRSFFSGSPWKSISVIGCRCGKRCFREGPKST